MIHLGINRTVSGDPQNLHGLAEVLDTVTPLETQPDGSLAFGEFAHRDTGTVDEPRLNTAAPDLTSKPASLFTGRMRLLAQDHYSRGPSRAFPFESRSGLTHGLHVGADGRAWVIEIGGAGIRAGLLATRHAFANAGAPTDLGAFEFWADMALPANWIALGVAPATLGLPWAGEGWAFNDAGTSAVLVCRDDKNGFPFTRLYRIDITLDATPAPASAALTVVESGYCWQQFFELNPIAHLKTPLSATDMRVVPVLLHNDEPAPPADAFDAPVYAFFKGAVLEVVRWHFVKETASNTATAPPGDGLTGTFGTTQEATSTACYSSSMYGVEAATSSTGSKSVRRKGPMLDGVIDTGRDGADQRHAVEGQVYSLVTELRDGAADVHSVTDVVVIPLRDREAVYHFRVVSDLSADDGTAKTYNGWWTEAPEAHLRTFTTAAFIQLFRDDPPAQPGLRQVFPVTSYTGTAPRASEYYAGNPVAGGPVIRGASAQGTVDAWIAAANANFAALGNTTVLEFDGIDREFGTPDTLQHFVQYRVRDRDTGALQFIDVFQERTLVIGEVAVPVIDTTASPADPGTRVTTPEAKLAGSLTSATLAVDEAEIDDWTIVKVLPDAQQWLVCQDANSNGRTLYSEKPSPEGGALGATLAGTTHYLPATIRSEYLGWVGRP